MGLSSFLMRASIKGRQAFRAVERNLIAPTGEAQIACIGFCYDVWEGWAHLTEESVRIRWRAKAFYHRQPGGQLYLTAQTSAAKSVRVGCCLEGHVPVTSFWRIAGNSTACAHRSTNSGCKESAA